MPSQSAALFARLPSPFTAESLFDCLLDVVFFVKNERAQYVVVNQTLADRCGFRDKRDLLGKTAEQVAPAPLGRTALEQDMTVLRTGKPIRNQLELHVYPTGRAGWCLTDKFPLTEAGGRVIGLAGVSHDLHAPDESAGQYRTVAAAVNHARTNLERRLQAGELAKVAGLSTYQFDQRIRRLFRLTTGQLLLKFRMDSAAELLRNTSRSVTQVGHDCGFADQSAFARQFRRTTGFTPGEYRRAFRASGEAD